MEQVSVDIYREWLGQLGVVICIVEMGEWSRAQTPEHL